jgi:hypothetical protein
MVIASVPGPEYAFCQIQFNNLFLGAVPFDVIIPMTILWHTDALMAGRFRTSQKPSDQSASADNGCTIFVMVDS